MITAAKAYDVLQHNKKLYKHPYSFYRTADSLGMSPSELGKFFAKARQGRSQRADSAVQMAMPFMK